jgi:tetratricopeptide (TPR) repeat protein
VEARALVERAGAGDRAAGIVETGEGNPLFLEQLVAVGAEGGGALPTTIQAVLAARIDRLEPGERSVLAQASVQGRTFYAGAIEEPGAATRLVALVHKQLIHADRSDIPGQDAFSFAHVLIREAAYRSLPKQRRAELHERFARWLEARPGAEDETVGYHLAAAHAHRTELGEDAQDLAWAAAERLTAAADAALLRGDHAGGARLLERVAALLEHDAAARGEVLPTLGAALFEAGRIADATSVLDEAIAAAPEPRLLARARIERELVRLESGVGTAGTARAVDEALQALAGDDFGQCRAWLLRGQLAWVAGQAAEADAELATAADAARRAGSDRELFAVIGWRSMVAALGPTPVADAIAQCEAFRELVSASPVATASTLNPLALLHAMAGDFELAAALLDEANAILQDLGGFNAGVSHLEAFTRLLAGQPELVEARLRADVETLSAMSEGGVLATTTAVLAQAVYAQGRVAEAGELCRAIDGRTIADDILTLAVWQGTHAKVLAHEGRNAEAEAMARENVARIEPTDLLLHRSDAMLDLADVLAMCGRGEEAQRAIAAALALYERKGNVAGATRAHDRRGAA